MLSYVIDDDPDWRVRMRDVTWRDYVRLIVRGRLRIAWRLRKVDKIVMLDN